MADIRCPNCGKLNPDLLDVCQFCQSPLKPDAVLRIGQQPTKKKTGELEPNLPDWLKDIREKARTSAEEDAAQASSQPQVSKDDPLDFLAGLSSQSESKDEENVPDWFANLDPKDRADQEGPVTSSSSKTAGSSAAFDGAESEDLRSEARSSAGGLWDPVPPSNQRDELSDWFAQASTQPDELVEVDPQTGEHERVWPGGASSSAPEEDLGWLRNLEESSRQTGELQPPRADAARGADLGTPGTAQPSSENEDLSWLNDLGGIEGPATRPGEPDENMDWLNQLGSIPPAQRLGEPQSGASSAEDLSWLNNLGAAPQAAQPFDAAPDRPLASTPFTSDNDLSWLNDLGERAESTHTDAESSSDAPLLPGVPFEERTGAIEPAATEPDWFKSTTEEPSMPPPGDPSMDWFRQSATPAEEKAAAASRDEAEPLADMFSTPVERRSLSNQDVDSLFGAEMPDWLARPEAGTDEPISPQPEPSVEGEEALAPVDLPSWVQAMRPVEALIPQAAPGAEDEPEEQAGPLAGLRGVIPGAPIGSASRPKAIPLKLQVSDQQQASAALLEHVLASETNPRALVDAPFIASQQLLRWVLAGIILFVLAAVLSLRPQIMPVTASLSGASADISSAVLSIPAGSNVLVVIDYEPSLAGELEVIGAPLLNQLVSLGRPTLSLLSTSPNGPVLIERLLTRAGINTPNGFGYQEGSQYRNLGFLPGGSAGVLGFIEQPGQVMPRAEIGAFSEYAAVVILTDHAESGRVWIEQLHAQLEGQAASSLTNQPLLLVASAQAGPLLQPYVDSRQVSGMVTGLTDAARYEATMGTPGAAQSYWDAFGIGLAASIVLILLGSLWSLLAGLRGHSNRADGG